MHIAQIAPLTEAIPPKLYGGTERVVHWLTEELVALGHDVTLFASGDSCTSAKLEAFWPRALPGPAFDVPVAEIMDLLVATGERLTGKWEFQEVLENDAAAILQVNVGLNGLLESKKIAGMAEAHYAQIAPWTYCGPVTAAASIQLDACSPNFLIQEGIEDWSGFAAEILREPIAWEDGFVIPSDRPGLGVEPDEKILAKYPPHEVSGGDLSASLRSV